MTVHCLWPLIDPRKSFADSVVTLVQSDAVVDRVMNEYSIS